MSMRLEDKKIILVSLGLIIVTLNLWIISKANPADIVADIWLSISQISALIGTVFLGFELILTSRLSVLEKLFGSLDKIYGYHKSLSIFSLISIITHFEFLIIRAISLNISSLIYILPDLKNLAYSSGIMAFYLMSLTIITTLYFKLPYHIWKITHKLLALSTIVSIYHVLTINSDISNNIPLRSWTLGFLVIGIIMMLYKVLLYKNSAKKFIYHVKNISIEGEIIKINLHPQNNKILHSPGQFAYFTFISKNVSIEEHPFSISSQPNSDSIILGIKMIGKYTKSLSQLNIGDLVEIRGPFGAFGEPNPKSEKEMWLGAGIGITPILSLQNSLPTELIYVTKKKTTIFDEELSKLAQNGVTINRHISSTMGQLELKTIISKVKEQDSVLRVCAPMPMLSEIKQLFESNKIPLEKLIYEDFDLFN